MLFWNKTNGKIGEKMHFFILHNEVLLFNLLKHVQIISSLQSVCTYVQSGIYSMFSIDPISCFCCLKTMKILKDFKSHSTFLLLSRLFLERKPKLLTVFKELNFTIQVPDLVLSVNIWCLMGFR